MKTDYDVIVAGAGIVGLASALKMLEARPDIKLLVVDKEPGPAMHQTGNNSGVIHSGIYYKPGSLKAVNCINGYRQLVDFCNQENIPYEICGKVIVAVNNNEIKRLNDLYNRGIENGLDKIRLISKDELNELEPHVNGISAIHVPYAGITDFSAIAKKYADKIREYNGSIKFNFRVLAVKTTGHTCEISSPDSSFTAKVFVNCCGLFSDEVAELSGLKMDTRIIPFRGEYYKLKPSSRNLVNNLVYPVPDPEFPFLGVHFTRMINGDIEAGPNAVLSFKKEGYKRSSFSIRDVYNTFTWPGFMKIASKYFKTGMGEFYRSYSKQAFVNSLRKLIPEITANDLVPGGAGVRAQAVNKNGKLIDDFLIYETGNIINVLNAPSPAATSSLAIGDTISKNILKRIS